MFSLVSAKEMTDLVKEAKNWRNQKRKTGSERQLPSHSKMAVLIDGYAEAKPVASDDVTDRLVYDVYNLDD